MCSTLVARSAARLLGDLRGERAARGEAAQYLFAAHRPAAAGQHVAQGDAELGRLAEARLQLLDRDAQTLESGRDIGRRAGPCAQLARIAEHRSDGDVVETGCTQEAGGKRIHAAQQNIAVGAVASDQPVACWCAKSRQKRHKLITFMTGARAPILRPMDASIDERAPVDLTSDAAPTSDAIRAPVLAVRELVYFGSEVRDASTVKRVQQFIDHGFAVTVFGFHRTRYNNDYQPPWPHVTLGTTIDGRYGHRLLRAALGHSDAVRPPPPLRARLGVLCPQHRPAAAGHGRAPARRQPRPGRLRSARHPADPDAQGHLGGAAALDRAALPRSRPPAGAVVARLPPQLLRRGAAPRRPVVPGREQAPSLDRADRPAGDRTSRCAAAGRGWSAISA